MLQFFVTTLREFVCVGFLSSGSPTRNPEIVEMFKHDLSSRLGVHADTFHFSVYSSKDCFIVPNNSPLQPDSNNNPHVPVDSPFFLSGARHAKKILSHIFGSDISDVILVDNTGGVVVTRETANLMHVPTFEGFSGSDLLKFQASYKTFEAKLDCNMDFLEENPFYTVHIACYITGMVSEIIFAMFQLNISATHALSLLQICPETNKYKYALIENKIYERYEPQFYYKGFTLLSNIHKPTTLFSPYPELALNSLKSLCDSLNSFIKWTLIEVTNDYWMPYIYYLISGYYRNIFETDSDVDSEEEVLSTTQDEMAVTIVQSATPDKKSPTNYFVPQTGLPSQTGLFSHQSEESITTVHVGFVLDTATVKIA